MSTVTRQPLIHRLTSCVAAPCAVLSAADGQLAGRGAEGVFVADVRVLSVACVSVGGVEPEHVATTARGAGSAEFVAVLRTLGDDGPDPTVFLRRRRHAEPVGCTETLTLVNATARTVSTTVRMELASDLAAIETVKSGARSPLAGWALGRRGLELTGATLHAEITSAGAEVTTTSTGGTLQWQVAVPARGEVVLEWQLRVRDHGAVVRQAVTPATFRPPAIASDDPRLAALVGRAVDDLAALRMSTVDEPEAEFLAAGSPWYFTLFGRDAIWAARMLLPLTTAVAHGTLTVLAARQGAGDDRLTAEQPGKILHELRRNADAPAAASLPPVYYGTIDSTPLWVCLLADAWRWGLDAERVEALLPVAERALAWMAHDGDADGDGFLEYIDSSGRGLANQGWKDSSDAVRFADGTIAGGPIALAEVQGYAYEAARAGADLLDAFGRPGAAHWREFAARIATAFRETFWLQDDLGPYPAMALDGNKAPVDSPASNMGHLLASGMLTREEAESIARRLVHPTMFSGFGVRTMSTRTGGYSPWSYHCGSVWPHDTAIALHGLTRLGFRREAVMLADGLLSAGAAFDGRLPELFAGFDRSDIPVPVPYPAACRPQAWSAASAVTILQAFLGLRVDAPGGAVTVAPTRHLGAWELSGIAVGGEQLRVTVRQDGTADASLSGPRLRLLIDGH